MIALKIDVINSPNQAIDVINSPNRTIDATNAPNQVINVVNSQNQAIEVRQDVIVNVNPAETYESEHEVTPKFVPQTLNTADKMLTKDITIGEIPYTETPNSAGGVTVTIG